MTTVPPWLELCMALDDMAPEELSAALEFGLALELCTMDELACVLDGALELSPPVLLAIIAELVWVALELSPPVLDAICRLELSCPDDELPELFSMPELEVMEVAPVLELTATEVALDADALALVFALTPELVLDEAPWLEDAPWLDDACILTHTPS